MEIPTELTTPPGPLCVLLSDEAGSASDTSARNLQPRNEIRVFFPVPGRRRPLVVGADGPLVGVALRVRGVVR